MVEDVGINDETEGGVGVGHISTLVKHAAIVYWQRSISENAL